MYDEIINSCQFLLNNYPEAQDTKTYLNSRLASESQNNFQFGYFPNLDNLTVLTSLIGEDVLRSAKILYSKEIEDSLYPRIVNFSYFDNYPLIMPFKNVYGKNVALVGRSILSEVDRKKNNISKYKNTVFEKGNHLFGLYENRINILKSGMSYVVEGQFDLIKASENGINNIVALGNSNMTVCQFFLLKRYTNNIILLLDNDEAGEKGRERIMDKFSKFANIQNFYLPDSYKDIDEFLSLNKDKDLSFIVKS